VTRRTIVVDGLLVFVSWGWQDVGRNENRHFWIWEVSSFSSSFNVLTKPLNETVHYFVLGQGPHPFSPGAHTDIRVFQYLITESVGVLVDCRRCLNTQLPHLFRDTHAISRFENIAFSGVDLTGVRSVQETSHSIFW